MAEFPLTCEACRRRPAEFLVVAQFAPPTGRAKQMQCEPCVGFTRSVQHADDLIYVFALTPVNDTLEARRG